MDVKIYARDTIQKLLKDGFPNHVAVISFSDPELYQIDKTYTPVDYSKITGRVFQIALPDLDVESLDDCPHAYETFFPEALDLGKFIYSAERDGLDIICQCEYGQSRSAGCAAAILEHFYRTGISIFSDYRYCPNQVIYHKVFDALEAMKNSLS